MKRSFGYYVKCVVIGLLAYWFIKVLVSLFIVKFFIF